jgi:hypothetical protein
VCGSAINDQKDLVLGSDDQAIKKIYEAKLIYPALRGGVESGPEEPIEAAPQRFFLLSVGSIGSGMIQLRSIEAFAQSNSRTKDIVTSSAAVRNRDLTRSPRPPAKLQLSFCPAM